MSERGDNLNQILRDAVAAARTTAEDTDIARTYADYLRDLSDREVNRERWRRKWAAYAGGLADGPTTDEEFESIRAERAAGGTGDRRRRP